jgi:hypothetical protein
MRMVKRIAVLLAAVFVVMQLVPYGWRHSNPPVTQDAPWPSEEARALAVTACYDCHSNETKWRWYSYVAPASWLVRSDVDKGRDKLNFSEWDRRQRRIGKADNTVEKGQMPPGKYTIIHPDAKLSATEKQTLIDALEKLDRGD